MKGNEKAGVVDDAVRLEFGKLLKALGLKRLGLGFYALRHTFRTVADGVEGSTGGRSCDGPRRTDMASIYRERIEDDRLEAVVKVVRDWLWPVLPGYGFFPSAFAKRVQYSFRARAASSRLAAS